MHPNLLAAEGWIELSNFDEAAEELHNCAPAIKSSVQWVKLWVRVCAATHRWREVEMMRETLAKHVPDHPFTIFNQAQAFRVGQVRSQTMFQPIVRLHQATFHNLALCCAKAFLVDLKLLGDGEKN